MVGVGVVVVGVVVVGGGVLVVGVVVVVVVVVAGVSSGKVVVPNEKDTCRRTGNVLRHPSKGYAANNRVTCCKQICK